MFDTFQANTMFNFADGTSCTIHTSCSVPLVAGDQIGPFVVIAGSGELGFECDIDQIQPPSPTVPTTSVPTTPTPPLPRGDWFEYIIILLKTLFTYCTGTCF